MGRKPKSAADWIDELRKSLVDGKGINPKSWDGDYLKILKRLPQGESLTVEALKEVVLGTQPNTKTRKRACMAVGALSKIARLKFDPSLYAGDYNCAKSPIKKLPDDEAILAFGQSLKNPSWRYVWGLMACYGVRPHEAFFCDRDALKRGEPGLRILRGKTGPRISYPYPPSWILRFRLGSGVPLPKIDLDRDNASIGHSAGAYFADRDCPWNLYQLRHRYAIRLRERGVSDHIAARYMGHSEEVHRGIYLRHVVPADLQNEWIRTNGQALRLNDVHLARKLGGKYGH